MSVVKIRKGISSQDLETIYSDEYITNSFKQDSRDFKPIIHSLATYWSCFIDNEFVGAFLSIRYSLYEIEFHSLLLKSSLRYGRQLGELMIEESFKDSNVLRLTGPILGDLKKAQNYVKKLGFKHEGTKKNATIRNGKKIDSLIFGLAKEDYE